MNDNIFSGWFGQSNDEDKEKNSGFFQSIWDYGKEFYERMKTDINKSESFGGYDEDQKD